MKKRNQFVSALLTGVVIGGTAVGVAASAPVTVRAADMADMDAGEVSDAEGEDVSEEEEIPKGEDVPEMNPADADGDSEETGNSDTGSAAEANNGEVGDTEENGGTGDTGTGDNSGSADTGDTGTGDNSGSAGTADTGTGDNSGKADTGDTGTGDNTGNAGAGDDGSGDTGANADGSDSGATEESMESDAGNAADAAEAGKKTTKKKTPDILIEGDDFPEESEEDGEAESSGYGTVASNRAYYSGTYFVTAAQRRLALNVGFEQVKKVYAMSGTDAAVNIREGKGLDQRLVGSLPADGILYILEDDGGDWLFVESGEVRGYVYRGDIKTGEEIDAIVGKAGEENLPLAEQLIDPLENTAYRASLKTTKELNSLLNSLGEATVDRRAMISFSQQFLGNPYVWGGDSLTEGCDCSGFTQQVYAEFGMSLPRCSYEQAEVGVKIPAEEALPGDLLFYARNGSVYHVLMYVGDGKAINASSSATGVVISRVDYDKVCWACRFIEETSDEDGQADAAVKLTSSGTQASDLTAVGQMAYAGDETAQKEIIEVLAEASMSEYSKYGFARSVIIAQAINESGWLSFPGNGAGILSTDNNVLGMNADLNNNTWTSPWNGRSATRLVPQYRNGGIDYDFEDMRLYEDIESCLEDYAAFKIGTYAQLRGETDVDEVIEIGLAHYATDPSYQDNIRNLIEKYDLTRYDVFPEDADEQDGTKMEDDASDGTDLSDVTTDSVKLTYNNPTDDTEYTDEQLNLICAIVAETDDTTYEGALAAVSTAMNRADEDYGGYGRTALSQLKAEGQYVYSRSVDSTQHYQNRLNGNVPDFVKKAVSDCLDSGIRDTSFNTVSFSERDGAVKIGSCWYYSK